MNSRLPPVPDENLSHKGTGEKTHAAPEEGRGIDPSQKNFDQQGRQGNIKVNTTNQGYQQDR
ncbi:hypothetical protein [Rhizobium sp. SL86]|jgi:hypothetical protein|uniref:hypothetical protein n=1 Tax=Rhizobium sp. SL86 TaxID=2995148 RepID=UPI00227242CB|nr:hypothetical protein [Rhizobium sp. SL86]MCY1667215.1 hypothetical protein [Rhizobium sp. SL86]